MAARKNLHGIGYRRTVQLLVYLIIVPTGLLLSLGILVIYLGEARFNLLLGILILSLVAVLVTGSVLVWVFLRRAASLSELQADFVSKVSHELRTPLTAIRLFTETMTRTPNDEATRDKCLAALSVETERLSARIERLLDWGRMEAGRRLYELREQPIAPIIDEAIAAFSPLRFADEMQFTCELASDLPPVRADRHALVDAVVNLLSNACKYGGTPPSVRLRVYAADESVVIEVTDNGQGIPRVEHRRIFDKFYRIDDRLSRAREGSGLGLAIVKHVVRAHRGRITLYSVAGDGSTFRILLPAVAAKRPPASRANEKVVRAEAKARRTHDERFTTANPPD